MDTIQNAMNRWLDELPRTLLADLIDQKMGSHSVRLSKKKRDELANKILTEKLDSFEFDEGPKRRRKKKITIEFTESDSELIEEGLDDFIKRLPATIADLIDQTSQSLLRDLKRNWRRESRAQRRDLNGFRNRLEMRWGEGLEKLRMLITIAREYGSELNNSFGRTRDWPSPKAFQVLIKLHARSCQVAEEVVCLLGSGLADGAMARWRTLQEIAAVGYLIERYGEDLAERYESHQIIESRKAALQYQRYQKRLGQEPIPEAVLKKIEGDRDALLAKYGADFANSQGWAARHLEKRDPSIADIQEAAGIDYLAPYYRMASHNVHANPKGVFFKLGLIGEEDILLAGPSNAGLADPGHATALSLVQICSSLLSFHPTIDNQIAMKVMLALDDEIGGALIEAHNKLEADEKKFIEARPK